MHSTNLGYDPVKIKLSILLVSVSSLLACSPSNDTTAVESIQEPLVTSDTASEAEMPKSDSQAELTSIPMSDSFENGRYFLTSRTTENGIENIEYIRKGDNNTSYGKMQIKCSNNEIKKYSADNSDALQSADMGNWITPAPDWTDQDIVNFICK